MTFLKNSEINFEKYYFFFLIVCWVVCLVWSSELMAFLSPDLREYTLRIIFDYSNVKSLLLTMGEIMATILAIFFSISIIVIQHTASNYTPSILEGYKNDSRTWFVFFLYSGSIAMIIIVLQYPSNSYWINMVAVTFIFSFLFLSSQFLNIVHLIDPRTIIEKAKRQNLKEIRDIPSKLKSVMARRKPTSEFQEKLMKSPIYAHFILHDEQTLLASSKKRISQISDVILKSSSRREFETCVYGLDAFSEIARNYVFIRREDPSQRDSFLQHIFDQLLSVSEIAFDNRDVSLLNEIIKTFEKVGCSTTDIGSISFFGGPNQLTSLAMCHTRDLGKKAIEKNLFDVSAQAVSSIKAIGVMAIQKRDGEGLASEWILDIGILANVKLNWFVLGYAFEGLKELLFSSVSKKINIHKEPRRILENIEKLADLSIKSNLAYEALQGSFFPMLPEFSIQKVSWMCFQIKNEEYPKIETNSREKYCKQVMSKLMQTLGKIAVITAKKRSSRLLGRTVDYVLKITISMLNEKFITIKEGFNDEVMKVVDYLKSSHLLIASYAFDSGWMSSVPSEITDAITSIAIYALEVERVQVADHCLKALQLMSVGLVERDKYGYDVARGAGRIGIVGAYALHRKEKNLSDKATELLANFDKIYLQKSPSPQDREHIGEMNRLHNRFQTDPLPFETELYGKLFKEVSPEVLEEFAKLYEKKRKKIIK